MSGVLGRSPPLPRRAASPWKGKETIFKHLARRLSTFRYNHNQSINLWDTLAQKMGPQDEDWNQGAERLKWQSCHSSQPPAPAAKPVNIVSPLVSWSYPSQALSWPQGPHPWPAQLLPRELWNRRQEEWVMSLQLWYPKQKEGRRTNPPPYFQIGLGEGGGCEHTLWILCFACPCMALSMSPYLGHTCVWTPRGRWRKKAQMNEQSVRRGLKAGQWRHKDRKNLIWGVRLLQWTVKQSWSVHKDQHIFPDIHPRCRGRCPAQVPYVYRREFLL